MTAVRLAERSRRRDLVLTVMVAGSDLAGRSFSEATKTVNVSGGGLAFETRRRLEVGSRVILDIKLPPRLRRHFGGHDRYRVRAVVCRVVAGGRRAEVGVRFTGEA